MRDKTLMATVTVVVVTLMAANLQLVAALVGFAEALVQLVTALL